MLTPAQRRLADLLLAGLDAKAIQQRLGINRSRYNCVIRELSRALDCQRDDVVSVLRGERRTPDRTIAKCREQPRQWWTV
jgi:hypothetical protein